jgi:hypothetical protein
MSAECCQMNVQFEDIEDVVRVFYVEKDIWPVCWMNVVVAVCPLEL